MRHCLNHFPKLNIRVVFWTEVAYESALLWIRQLVFCGFIRGAKYPTSNRVIGERSVIDSVIGEPRPSNGDGTSLGAGSGERRAR